MFWAIEWGCLHIPNFQLKLEVQMILLEYSERDYMENIQNHSSLPVIVLNDQ